MSNRSKVTKTIKGKTTFLNKPKKKEQIILRPDKRIAEFNGKTFREKKTKYKKIDGIEHIDYVIWEEIDISKEQKKIDYLKDKLTEFVSNEEIVGEVLKGISLKEVDRIYKLIKKDKAKITKQKGCLGLKIDAGKRKKVYLELFD